MGEEAHKIGAVDASGVHPIGSPAGLYDPDGALLKPRNKEYEIREKFEAYFLTQLAGSVIDLLATQHPVAGQKFNPPNSNEMIVFLIARCRIGDFFNAWHKDIVDGADGLQAIQNRVAVLQDSITTEQLIAGFIDFCRMNGLISSQNDADFLLELCRKFREYEGTTDDLAWVSSSVRDRADGVLGRPEVY